MAVDTTYITAEETIDWIRDPNPDGIDLDIIEVVREATSRAIDAYCNVAHFYPDDTATARVFVPSSYDGALNVDDFWELSSVKVDLDDDGTYEATWTAPTHFRPSPFNGLTPSGIQCGYRRIVPAYNKEWPMSRSGFPTVEVTAKWGWPEVPSAVRMAARILASKLDYLKFARAGVAAVGDFGPIRVQGNRDAEMLLEPLRVTRTWQV